MLGDRVSSLCVALRRGAPDKPAEGQGTDAEPESAALPGVGGAKWTGPQWGQKGTHGFCQPSACPLTRWLGPRMTVMPYLLPACFRCLPCFPLALGVQ